MYEDFSKYMNEPEKPIEIIGKKATRTDYLVCDIQYIILDIIDREGRWYAVCSYTDDFTDEECTEEIFLPYLEISDQV